MRIGRRFLLGLSALVLAVGVAAAQAGPPADTDAEAIRNVIARQVEAFRADDGEAAFAFASPGIRRQFGNATTFMDMVRGGYAPVYRPRSLAFGSIERFEDVFVQRVRVIGSDGRRVLALYAMERQPDGSWRIAGCQLVADDDESV
jgi:hypothetical protein